MKKVVTKISGKEEPIVTVRDYEVEKCIKNGENMDIHYEDQIMTLSPNSLETKKINTSKPIASLYGGKDYCLIDYKWVPNKTEDD